jgi:hypothetical protein
MLPQPIVDLIFRLPPIMIPLPVLLYAIFVLAWVTWEWTQFRKHK